MVDQISVELEPALSLRYGRPKGQERLKRAADALTANGFAVIRASNAAKAYEAVLGRQLDKRNFRKKILALGLIEPVGETAMRGAHRPAMLYRFTSREPQFVDML